MMGRWKVFGILASFAVMSFAARHFALETSQDDLPVLFPMPAFELTDEQGQAFSSHGLLGKVAIANFIFTSCPSVCPRLTDWMARVQHELAPQGDAIHLLSFSVDPKNDTPARLKAFAARFQQDPRRWTFLTGDASDVERAVEQGFKIGMGPGPKDAFDIVHGEHFVLVDGSGQIRGYYQPKPESIAALIHDAKRLVNP